MVTESLSNSVVVIENTTMVVQVPYSVSRSSSLNRSMKERRISIPGGDAAVRQFTERPLVTVFKGFAAYWARLNGMHISWDFLRDRLSLLAGLG